MNGLHEGIGPGGLKLGALEAFTGAFGVVAPVYAPATMKVIASRRRVSFIRNSPQNQVCFPKTPISVKNDRVCGLKSSIFGAGGANSPISHAITMTLVTLAGMTRHELVAVPAVQPCRPRPRAERLRIAVFASIPVVKSR